MKELSELKFPEGFQYAEDHEWAKKEGAAVRIGISDYAQDQLGDIVFVEMPDVGDDFAKGDEIGSLESVKAVSELFIPVSGEVTAVNEKLEDAPELINSDPFGDGWIIEVKPSDPAELDALMDSTAYLEMLKNA